MIEIRNLRDVFRIINLGSGNSEVDRLVKDYYSKKNRAYRHIIKFHYLNPTTTKESMCIFGLKLKEYREIRDEIIEDVRQITYDYYKSRKIKFRKKSKVIDILDFMN